MAKIEDQRILVFCNEDNNLKQAIIDAAFMALKLEKEVCLFGCYVSEKGKERLRKKIDRYSQVLVEEIPELELTTLLLKGKLKNLVKELGEKFNTIMLISGGKMSNSFLSAFYRSGFPYYFARKGKPAEETFRKIIIPVDFRNSTKDSILWGSYLGRFNNSEITLHKANDKDSELSVKVNEALSSSTKLYSKFSFPYRTIEGQTGSWRIHKEALKKAGEYDLFIFSGSLNVTLPDKILGVFEKRIVNRSLETPVLLINPQVEMYVICS